MPSPRKRSLTTAPNAIARKVENATHEDDEHDEDERVATRRAETLQRRQIELDILMDSHDDLVREAFQLDKFVTLLSYDPKVAKQDNSQVFLEYKTPHDLLSKSVAASGSGVNSRKTRRATTEFRESLAATISTGPSTPPATPFSTPSKGKSKARVSSGLDSVSPLGKNLGRAKVQARDVPSKVSFSAMKGKGKAKEIPRVSSSSLMAEVMPPPPSSLSTPRRDHHPRKVKDGLTLNTSDTSEPITAFPTASSRPSTRAGLPPSSISHPPNGRERSRRSLGDPKREAIISKPAHPESLEDPIPQVHPKSTIKRIRLFQRPRPAAYTHPSQIPPRPLYGSSIVEFLTSFTSLEDGSEVTRDELENIASVEAKTRARIRDLRRQGRLMLDIPELPDGSLGVSNLVVPDDAETHEAARDEDHYDHLVSAASRRGLIVATEHVAKKATAKKVAKLVMAWHGNKESVEEKQRKTEAARIKNLAKLTAKEVEKQWKKAILAVREQNRAVLDAEEALIGQKHLDAILDQSGAILEAQHTDLSRARSRSSSAKDWSDSDESDGDIEEGGLEELSVNSGSDNSDDFVAEDDGADVTWLLGADVFSSLDTRGPSSDLEIDSAVLKFDGISSRGSSPKETPSRSEGSLDTPRLNEGMDVSLSTTPSEAVPDDRPSTGAKTIPSASPVFNSTDELLSERDDIPQRDSVSETSIVLEDVDPLGSVPADEGSILDSPTIAYPRQKSYRSSSPSLSSLHDLNTSTPPSPPSAVVSIPPPRPHSQHPLPLDQPSVSSGTTQADGNKTPQDTTGAPSHVSQGHKAVAVRLSNGVVIYRDIDDTLPLEEASDINLSREAIKSNSHQPEHSPSSSNILEVPESPPESSRERLDSIVAHRVNGQHEAGSSTMLGVGSTIDPTAGSMLMEKTNDHSSPDVSTTTIVNGVGKETNSVSAGDQAPLIAASPSANDEDFAVDEPEVAPHLVEFAAASVEWDDTSKVNPPFLLRGNLRPYQQSGLEWLASLHTNSLNGILADEMGLGKTIQTISLLAHLACDLGIWGPHLIVVPTSVLLNWEMEFKKFLPGFKILPYHGSTKRRKELRVGWNNKHSFNVCVTSYTLASRDAHIFKRKSWYYMILDEAHMIKNFKSQRWNILLMFRSFRRLLLTGTPLQNNLTELWALLQFLMSGTNFANLKEFGDWFSNPLEKAIEQGTVLDEETQERVRKLHTVLRPYLLRRLKADVEKELPSKYEHLVMCRLSKRQRFLYDEFMSRAQTRDALASGVYHKVANILMQLRKVCNHPDLFEVRPIVTSFAMPRSATVDFEVKDLLVRRRFLKSQEDSLNLDFLGLAFVQHQGKSMMQARSTRNLDASSSLPFTSELPGEPPPVDTRSIDGFKRYIKYQRQLVALRQWTQIAYTNHLRCAASPIYGSETISVIRRLNSPLVPLSDSYFRHPDHLDRSRILPTLIKSYEQREEDMVGYIDRFAFVTPPAVARDMPPLALSGCEPHIFRAQSLTPGFDTILHRASVKLQIAFPDASLIQFDCGKLQELASLLHKRKAGGHRVLIFTQMTKVLDILEIFLNFHGYRYLRLDGATKIEDRQYITERFNNDARVFAFIASSRSGGVGINLTGADTVVFYDSDFNPQMDRQCEDRAHRIGQIRDVHIYRFISEHTVEESMLRKANQKRSLDNIVIQQGEFDWRSLLIDDEAFGKALGEFEDKEDAHAARVAAREEAVKAVEDNADFAGETDDVPATEVLQPDVSMVTAPEEEDPEEEGTIADYMLAFVKRDWEWFSMWR